MADLTIVSPMRGWAAPLDEVDDPVFSGRMLGDGVAVDPTGPELRAPCDAEVLSIHHAGHAISLKAANGAEILIHVGLETVALGGKGFKRHVRDGDEVKQGDLLLTIDLDQVAALAKSLITPVVITNGDDFAVVSRQVDRRVEIGEPLMVLRGGEGAQAREESEAPAVVRTVRVPLTHGLHARPSALVAAEAKRHRADVTLATGGRSANAKSPVAIMALGLGLGAEVVIAARGPEAEAAVAALADLIAHRLPPEPPSAEQPEAPAPKKKPSAAKEGRLTGTPAAPGLAIGRAHRLIPAEIAVNEVSQGAETETLALAAALDALRTRLAGEARGPREQREILHAHLAFLDDEELIGDANQAIAAGQSAGTAWRGTVRGQIEIVRAIADPRIAQRADDLADLERQVLAELAGETEPRQVLPAGAVIVADELGPGQLMGLEGDLAGICTAGGGPTSHVAILAAALGVPAVVALGRGVMSVPDGAGLIVDGDSGEVCVAPDAAEIEAAQTRLAERQARLAKSRAEAAEPCHTADGVRIEVFANLGSEADAKAAMANGAEGCGLLRTEFLFLERSRAPDEDEQHHAYQAIADSLAGAPLIIRTLDIGGDKPAPFLDLPVEENPALGLRGVRVSLWRPDLLDVQLRAILRVRPEGQCRILVPMVASLAELKAVKTRVEAARRQTGHAGPVEVGVMVETPAAAITADLLAAEADFLSIGTNDLTQYGLAMDRGNPQVASGVDALHPAVLRLIAAAARGAAAQGKLTAVCGGLAADAAGTAILIGLGVRELSAPPASIPEIKARVRALAVPACEDLAARALDCASAAEVRVLVRASESAG
ncbi:MAG TPA: phosphoenolpyruvate--protein phosphotransferase [Caulobacteraceae bacterium]|jgi:phosphocarrier protein FPr/phosphocarrier protein